MSSPEPTGLGPPQVYDPDGDLCLIIGREDPLSLIVCSKTLARASKFFKSLLYGGFEESKPADPNQEWLVSLPEPEVDDRAVDIVMNILHGSIHKIPDKILFCEGIERGGREAREEAATIVGDIATVADYWNVTHVLHPWANYWLDDSCRGISYRSHHWYDSLIQAAWHFGDEKLLAHQLGELVNEISSGAGDDYSDWHMGSIEPPRVYDHDVGECWELDAPRKGLEFLDLDLICSWRLKVLEVQLGAITSFLEAATRDTYHPCAYHKAPESDADWSWVSENLVDAFNDYKIYPIPEPQDFQGSIESLGSLLEQVREGFRTYLQGDVDDSGSLDCSGCFPIFREWKRLIARVEDAVERPRITTSDFSEKMKAHLTQQRKLSGIVKNWEAPKWKRSDFVQRSEM